MTYLEAVAKSQHGDILKTLRNIHRPSYSKNENGRIPQYNMDNKDVLGITKENLLQNDWVILRPLDKEKVVIFDGKQHEQIS